MSRKPREPRRNKKQSNETAEKKRGRKRHHKGHHDVVGLSTKKSLIKRILHRTHHIF